MRRPEKRDGMTLFAALGVAMLAWSCGSGNGSSAGSAAGAASDNGGGGNTAGPVFRLSVTASRGGGVCAWLEQVLFELVAGLDSELPERLA